MMIRNRSALAGWAVAACALGAVALAACKGTSTLVAAPASARRPAIAVAEARHDVGSVLEGDPVRHVFSLRNVGEDLRTIKRAQGS